MNAKVITTFRDKYNKAIIYKAGRVYDFTEKSTFDKLVWIF